MELKRIPGQIHIAISLDTGGWGPAICNRARTKINYNGTSSKGWKAIYNPGSTKKAFENRLTPAV